MSVKKNKIVDDFGKEWEKFNQIQLDQNELLKIYNDYFDIFPWDQLSKKSHGIDIGCGSGISGNVLGATGHMWVGTDISKAML